MGKYDGRVSTVSKKKEPSEARVSEILRILVVSMRLRWRFDGSDGILRITRKTFWVEWINCKNRILKLTLSVKEEKLYRGCGVAEEFGDASEMKDWNVKVYKFPAVPDAAQHVVLEHLGFDIIPGSS